MTKPQKKKRKSARVFGRHLGIYKGVAGVAGMRLRMLKFIHESKCSSCGRQLQFLFEEQRHYCQNCNRFFPPSKRINPDFALTRSGVCPEERPAKKPLREPKKSYATRVRWDALRKVFMIQHCSFHNFDPNEATLLTKCFARKCIHLAPQRRKEIVVSTLREAIEIKSNHSEILIEQTEDGFRLMHAK
jgi:hypothetical protein